MPPGAVAASVARAARSADLVLVEGKRGLFDGADARGTHSSAQLAKALGAPCVLVVSAAKVTRTISALVLGCRTLDPQLQIAGVVLNRVATGRQEGVIRRALADDVGIPVLGAIPRLEDALLPTRHLGLVCAAEHPAREAAIDALADAVGRHVDLDAVSVAAATASPPSVAASLTVLTSTLCKTAPAAYVNRLTCRSLSSSKTNLPEPA